jgi:hypothetical protein
MRNGRESSKIEDRNKEVERGGGGKKCQLAQLISDSKRTLTKKVGRACVIPRDRLRRCGWLAQHTRHP